MTKFTVTKGTPPSTKRWGGKWVISKEDLCPVCTLYPIRRNKFSWYVSGYDQQLVPRLGPNGKEFLATRITNQVHAWVCSKDCADLLIIQKM